MKLKTLSMICSSTSLSIFFVMTWWSKIFKQGDTIYIIRKVKLNHEINYILQKERICSSLLRETEREQH